MTHRTSSSSEATLQRGKACLSCRRRKMKCDGQRPYCAQCVKGNRAEDCEYTDNQGRTRTQMLEETVALLQARIHELENPRIASQSIRLHDPYAATRPHRTVQSATAPGMSRIGSEAGLWWEQEEPPAGILETLIGIFMPRAVSLGFALSPAHFLSDLHVPTPHVNRPHPALIHSVILWALHLSNSHEFMQHENLYLQRSILALQDALIQEPGLEGSVLARRRLHAMQAEVLLSQYFFSLGRLLEGRYHTNAAVSLSVSCGLHRTRPTRDSETLRPQASSAFNALELPSARTALEYGERIRLFWNIFVLDRCWSTVLGVPCLLTDDPVLGTQIDIDWPMDIADYEESQANFSLLSGVSSRTVQRLLSGEIPTPRRGSTLPESAFRVMAAAVFERASRLSELWFSSHSHAPSRASLRSEMQVIARTTTTFARMLTPVDELLSGRPSGHETQLIAHSLAHATMMTLHNVRSSESPPGDLNAINSRLVHASEILKVLEGLCGDSSLTVDPILSMVGSLAAQTFLQEEKRMGQISGGGDSSSVASNRLITLRASITRIISTLQRCAETNNRNAIFGQQADEISESLEQ
ncbi:hypothetical protein ACEPAF_4292 [Sanghuangporus sanghuang]